MDGPLPVPSHKVREYDVLPMWPRVGCTAPPPSREGWGGSYMQLAVPNVVAIAVRIVITMLRIFPQVLLLLKVPIVVKWIKD